MDGDFDEGRDDGPKAGDLDDDDRHREEGQINNVRDHNETANDLVC